ncbi:alpha/beta hydrolase family protein [Planctomonas deserti]|uniref:alpha/beta hydrolase family protein n=1 Tax=Planctomonas deserti TaxID=2144185 RepID=UPI000D381C5B|nr:alpha/beta family hydrolase [Planctomonas deserti]
MDVALPTSVGPSRLVVDEAPAARAALWLGHGAGGGVNAVDLAALAARLPALGITVLRYEQPWRTAGKRVAARPATLDVAWLEAAAAVAELTPGLPLVIGGRSAGARVACRTAAAVGASAVVCLSFPLHPPGSGPEKSRLGELLSPAVPVLVLQGDRDAFGSAAMVRAEVAEAAAHAREYSAAAEQAEQGADAGGSATERIRVVEVAGADHGLKALKGSPLTARGIADLVVETTAAFVLDLVR